MKLLKNKQNDKYDAYSFVELLITIAVVSVILLFVSLVLTTMIKASAISNARTMTRSESEFMLEFVRRAIRNSQSENILIYNSSTCKRVRNVDTLELEAVGGCADPYGSPIAEGVGGNEIHIRPSESDRWLCFGLFNDATGKGYILKTSSAGLTPDGHGDCFPPGAVGLSHDYKKYGMLLSSSEVKVNELTMSKFESQNNTLVTILLRVEPIYWIGGNDSQYRPEYVNQAVVSTQKLTR